MAKKCIGILMVALIESCILIVVKIQANNLNSTSLAHLDPIMIPHFSKLDETQNLKHQDSRARPKARASKARARATII